MEAVCIPPKHRTVAELQGVKSPQERTLQNPAFESVILAACGEVLFIPAGGSNVTCSYFVVMPKCTYTIPSD
jgi:hypothetical protein